MTTSAKSILGLWVIFGGACVPDSGVQTATRNDPVVEPFRTAFVGLVMTTHYQLPGDSGMQAEGFSLRFSLDDSVSRSPFAECAGRTHLVGAVSPGPSAWGKAAQRPAATLREAYAGCRTGGDVGALEQLEHGFGVEASLRFQDALLDSLTMLAHEISKQSLLGALYRDRQLGTVLPPEATILELGRFGRPGLRGVLMREVQDNAAAPPDRVAEACAALDVDALLFIAIEYAESVSDPESLDPSSIDPRLLRVDALVLTPEKDTPAARLRFEHHDSKQLAAFSSVGNALVRALNPPPAQDPSHPWSK